MRSMLTLTWHSGIDKGIPFEYNGVHPKGRMASLNLRLYRQWVVSRSLMGNLRSSVWGLGVPAGALVGVERWSNEAVVREQSVRRNRRVGFALKPVVTGLCDGAEERISSGEFPRVLARMPMSECLRKTTGERLWP